MGLISRVSSRTYRNNNKMGYPELDKLLPPTRLQESNFVSIINEDSPIDTHALFTLSHCLSVLLASGRTVCLVSYRFRQFELDSIFTKSGLGSMPRLLQQKKLAVFADFDAAIGSVERFDVLVLDGVSQVLEASELKAFVNTILHAQAVSKMVLVRAGLNDEFEDEVLAKRWLRKRSSLSIA